MITGLEIREGRAYLYLRSSESFHSLFENKTSYVIIVILRPDNKDVSDGWVGNPGLWPRKHVMVSILPCAGFHGTWVGSFILGTREREKFNTKNDFPNQWYKLQKLREFLFLWEKEFLFFISNSISDLPWLGSVNPKHPTNSPDASFGTYLSFCSLVPKV